MRLSPRRDMLLAQVEKHNIQKYKTAMKDNSGISPTSPTLHYANIWYHREMSGRLFEHVLADKNNTRKDVLSTYLRRRVSASLSRSLHDAAGTFEFDRGEDDANITTNSASTCSRPQPALVVSICFSLPKQLRREINLLIVNV